MVGFKMRQLMSQFTPQRYMSIEFRGVEAGFVRCPEWRKCKFLKVLIRKNDGISRGDLTRFRLHSE